MTSDNSGAVGEHHLAHDAHLGRRIHRDLGVDRGRLAEGLQHGRRQRQHPVVGHVDGPEEVDRASCRRRARGTRPCRRRCRFRLRRAPQRRCRPPRRPTRPSRSTPLPSWQLRRPQPRPVPRPRRSSEQRRQRERRLRGPTRRRAGRGVRSLARAGAQGNVAATRTVEARRNTGIAPCWGRPSAAAGTDEYNRHIGRATRDNRPLRAP